MIVLIIIVMQWLMSSLPMLRQALIQILLGEEGSLTISAITAHRRGLAPPRLYAIGAFTFLKKYILQLGIFCDQRD